MKFDKSKVYTAVNAEDVEVGSIVEAADTLADLKGLIEIINGPHVNTLQRICSPDSKDRFVINGCNTAFNLVYLIEKPRKLKWTDLSVGDILRKGFKVEMVTGIDASVTGNNGDHVYLNGRCISDEEINEWELVR